MDNVKCIGNETGLEHCQHSKVVSSASSNFLIDLKQDDCNGGEGAGVVCDTRDLKDILDSECFQVGFNLNLNNSFLALD